MTYILFVLLVCSHLYANWDANTALRVGELPQINYEGKTFPSNKLDIVTPTLINIEKKYFEDTYYSLISVDYGQLNSFLENELLVGNSCSNFSFSKNARYFRYLFRLLTLSFYYEELTKIKNTVGHIYGQAKACQFNWKEVISKCRPKNLDMKVFTKRAMQAVLSDGPERISQNHSFKNYAEEWLKQLQNKSSEDIVIKRYHIQCSNDKTSCDNNNLSQIEANFTKICDQDLEYFVSLCSEEDLLLGSKNSPILKDLILNSNVMNVINQNSDAEECLNRFIQFNQNKETPNTVNQQMIPVIATYVEKNLPTRFIQGRLFLPGALKEFDDKGLKEFLFIPTPTPVTTIAKISVPEVIKTPVPVITPQATLVPTVIVKLTATPTPVVESLKESAYLMAVNQLERKRLETIKVDMDQFKKDYELSEENILHYKKSLLPFFKIDVLKELRELDFLGTREQPFKLTTLKFLIDQNFHKELYNVKSVLGDKFFVENDLEVKINPKVKKQSHYMVSLLNNQESNFKWLITIHKTAKKL